MTGKLEILTEYNRQVFTIVLKNSENWSSSGFFFVGHKIDFDTTSFEKLKIFGASYCLK